MLVGLPLGIVQQPEKVHLARHAKRRSGRPRMTRDALRETGAEVVLARVAERRTNPRTRQHLRVIRAEVVRVQESERGVVADHVAHLLRMEREGPVLAAVQAEGALRSGEPVIGRVPVELHVPLQHEAVREQNVKVE